MSDKLRPVFYGLAILGAFWLYGTCQRRAGAADERLRIETRETDSTARVTDRRILDLAHRESTLVGTVRRLEQRDNGQRAEIARLRGRVHNEGTVVHSSDTIPGIDTSSGSVDGIAMRDSIIVLQDSLITSLDSAVNLWQALATERADIIERLTYERDSFQKQRDSFRRRAEAPRHTKTDVLGGALVGWGVAEENKDAIALGLGLLVVPRLATKLAGLLN